MPKTKKLFLVLLLAFVVDDICKYIKVFSQDRPSNIISFDFIVTRFDRGSVVNLSIIYIIIVSIGYFSLHFFDYSDFR